MLVGAMPDRRLRLAIAALLFLGWLALYLSTASRDVYWFDSPELTTTAINLDISHPPGYPLWNFLAHAFTLVPVGTLAFRVAAFLAGCLVAHRPSDALLLPLLLGMSPLPAAKLPVAVPCFLAAYTPYAYTWWHLTHRFSMSYFDCPATLETFADIVTGRAYRA